jgi:hypothetical protein
MIGVWTGMLIMALVQVPVLINRKQWKELAAFTVFWVVAGIYASLILGTFAGDLAIPNHTELLIRFFNTLYGWMGM